jgi:hypothetical protein
VKVKRSELKLIEEYFQNAYLSPAVALIYRLTGALLKGHGIEVVDDGSRKPELGQESGSVVVPGGVGAGKGRAVARGNGHVPGKRGHRVRKALVPERRVHRGGKGR